MGIRTPMTHSGMIPIITMTGMPVRVFISVLVGIGLITIRHSIMDGTTPISLMAPTTEAGGIHGDMGIMVVPPSGDTM